MVSFTLFLMIDGSQIYYSAFLQFMNFLFALMDFVQLYLDCVQELFSEFRGIYLQFEIFDFGWICGSNEITGFYAILVFIANFG